MSLFLSVSKVSARQNLFHSPFCQIRRGSLLMFGEFLPWLLTFFYPLCSWRLTFVIKALSWETSKYGRRCRKKSRCSKLCLHAVRYPVIYYTETLILLLLLISLFPRCYFLIKEPNNQFTYYMSLESFKLLFKIFNATFSWVFNP